jgi:Fe-S-cluster containining protein
MIYEVRPKACREYPHTDRKKFQQITDITLKNVAICPAAYNIVEEMKRKWRCKAPFFIGGVLGNVFLVIFV